VQRALDINADVVLMAKNGVTGVYDKDPNQCEDARRYKTITFNEVIERNLEVADQSAFILACDFNLPFYVFDFKNKDCIKDICEGRDVGIYCTLNPNRMVLKYIKCNIKLIKGRR